jgi:hypothetical protein
MPFSKARLSTLGAAVLCALASFGTAHTAHASPTFPPALQSALEQQFKQSFCVPQCSACHLTNSGGPGMMNVFGANLEKYGGLGPVLVANVAPAIQKYFTATPPAGVPQVNGEFDSDGDGVSDKDEILAGDSPSIALPNGEGAFCPDIKYGCAGGRIAKVPPPVDRISLFAAGLVVAGFAAIRRRSRRAG